MTIETIKEMEKAVTEGERYFFFGEEPQSGLEPSHYTMIDREIKVTRDYKRYFFLKRLNRRVIPNSTKGAGNGANS